MYIYKVLFGLLSSLFSFRILSLLRSHVARLDRVVSRFLLVGSVIRYKSDFFPGDEVSHHSFRFKFLTDDIGVTCSFAPYSDRSQNG